jgi:hypothetical protein
MTKLGKLGLVVVSVVGLVGCGGDDDAEQPDAEEISFIDGGIDAAGTTDAGPDAFIPGGECLPNEQDCAGAGDKCTDDGTGTVCAPAGTVAVGEPCAVGEDGIDDCVTGAYCIFSVCQQICTTNPADSCPEGSVCTGFDGLFDDSDQKRRRGQRLRRRGVPRRRTVRVRQLLRAGEHLPEPRRRVAVLDGVQLRDEPRVERSALQAGRRRLRPARGRRRRRAVLRGLVRVRRSHERTGRGACHCQRR